MCARSHAALSGVASSPAFPPLHIFHVPHDQIATSALVPAARPR
ncbi:hypothetical protein [Streptomyces luteogriseus]